ncbi:unnamed protein product [Cylicocyclus nassatus]|uniref:Uncharacterized protein n=1 Tax=Cylicocyclus nassatus TaxID=53992 RepID=A0AA36DL27_CYLNA|nr:unnamed protein product [Cylicocyclus nassatus]
MTFEEKTFCCSVTVAVVMMCSAELATIIIAYLTNVEHPLMRCQSYNVSVFGLGERHSVIAQRRICTNNGALLAWIIIHLFIDLIALIAIQTTRYRALLPYIFTAVIDLLMSSAYLVVLFVQMIRGDKIDNVLVIFIIFVVLFKSYSLYCSRRLYWILQSVFDRRYSTRTVVIKDDSSFQF